jgi:hypothetical protein
MQPVTIDTQANLKNRISTLADRARAAFEYTRTWRFRIKLDGVSVVGILGVLTGVVGAVQAVLLSRNCSDGVPVSRLEVTFSASRFASLLGTSQCAKNVEWSFVTSDVAFPICYGVFLSALFIWTERWRRFDSRQQPRQPEASRRRDLLVVVPCIAALFDLVVENLPLFYAARAILQNADAVHSSIVATAVTIGSIGAVVKWTLLLFFVVSLAAELLSGPRGVVLWRSRFSVLAVIMGGVPLLVVPQGQDILQRVFEADYRALRLAAAVPAILFAAVAIWYCSRKLLELRLAARMDPGDRDWYAFFSEHVPRLLGVLLLVLGGTAFARAGLAVPRFLIVGVISFFVALLIRRQWGRVLGSVARLFLPRSWAAIDELDQRVGRFLLAAILGILTFFPHWLPGEEGCPSMFCTLPDNERTILFLRIAAYLCMVSAWGLHLVVRFRREAANQRLRTAGMRERPAQPSYESEDPSAIPVALKRKVALAAGVSLFWLMAFTIAPVPVGRFIGPLWILSLATANAVFVGSVSVWIGRRYHVPIVPVAVLLAALFSLWNDNHSIRMLPGSIVPDARVKLVDHLDEWVKDLPAGSDPSGRIPVFLVAAQGGGLRAAYWTAISLATIQDLHPAFVRHVFAISGVSGGSLGGALFTALVRDAHTGAKIECPAPPGPIPQNGDHRYATCVRSFMRDDFLSPILAKLVSPDFLQWFLPFPVHAFDRSAGLERSLERSYQSITERSTFADGFAAFQREPAVRASLPTLLLNSTHVETGRRYIATSLLGDSDQQRSPFQDAGDMLDTLQADLPLSTAVHNSARFTYVSPAGHMDRGDGVERGRVVDGGYFENSGLTTLGEIYDVVNTRSNLMPIVLYLCNDPTPCVAETLGNGAGPLKSTAADELLSPVRALLNTLDAHESLRRAGVRAVLGDKFLQLNVCDRLPPKASRTVEPTNAVVPESRREEGRQRVVAPPLGWLLSKLARDWMDAALNGTVQDGPDGAGSCYASNASAIKRLVGMLPPAFDEARANGAASR